MKLRNKKTGEIVDTLCQENAMGIAFGIDHHDGNPTMAYYNSLAKLNKEWEDYEEPKDFWFIDPEILIACESTDPLLCDKKIAIETMKQIGNYFETKEEAEKAVEKLKAWERLEDKGFRFNRWTIPEEPKTPHIKLVIEAEMDVPDSPYDLDLLLGGEE